jgi:mannose-6-phosphate isomerase-like protein (cupin superfamily)
VSAAYHEPMSYTAASGERSAIWRPAADIPPLVRSSSSVAFTAPGSVTGGRYGLFRWEMQPNAGGPEAHFHKTFSEAFYVLEGTVHLFNGAGWVAANAGDFLYVPEGGIHAFRNQTNAPAAMLIVFAPGTPRERYFTELAEIGSSGRSLTPEEWTELYARNDQYMV